MLPRCSAIALTLFASFAGAATVHAQSQNYDVRPEAAQVKGKALTAAFKGVTHAGAYNFDARGHPGARYEERHKPDGHISYSERGQFIKGRWAVSNSDTICYSYDTDIIGGGCFRVYQLGNCYYFYSSQLLSREGELEQNYWTARSVKKGERATCEDMIS